MTDLFDAAAGALGGLLEPAAPALDFLGLGAADPMGRQQDAGSIIGTLGRGLQDAVTAGPAGLAVGAAAAAQPGLSARDRLLFGGMLLAGGAMTAKAAYSQWKASALARALPDMTQVAGPRPAVPLIDPDLRRTLPGSSERLLNIAQQPDTAGIARGLARFAFDPDVPDERLAMMASRLDEYESSATDLEPFAAYEWANLDDNGAKGHLPAHVQPIYDDFTEGLYIPDEDWLTLSSYARDAVDQELGGLTGGVSRIIDNNGTPMPVVTYKPRPAGNVYLDADYRGRRVLELNARPAFEQGVANLVELHRSYAAEPKSAQYFYDSDVPVRDAFLGVDSGATHYDYNGDTATHVSTALEHAADIIRKETGTNHEIWDLKSALANEWRSRIDNHPTSWREGNPYRLKPNGEENPAFLALIGAGNELPAHWSGAQGESLPAVALKTEAGDITLFVDKYDVTTAAEATRMSDAWMRNMFPGPLGDDGVPRWMPGRPLPVNSFDAIDAAALQNPAAVVETMHVGSYPGFQPGDYIAFDHNGKVPPWAQAATRMPGGAARERPERGMAKLGMERLQDADVTNEALASNAWAVFQWPTKNLVSDLRRDGYNTIPLQGDTATASPAILVFGLDADDAASRGATHTPAGAVVSAADNRDWLVPNRAGDRVPLSQHFTAGQGAGTGRVSRAVARYVYKVDQREAHQITKLAADLENTGAGNLVVYSRQPHIEGFESARERAFRGPAATVKVVRTADGLIGESNSVPVHIRPGSGLPTKALDIDPSEVSLGGVNFEVMEQLAGPRAEVLVEAEGDLFNRLRDAAELAQVYGHDKVDVIFEGKRIPLFKPDVFPEVRPQVNAYDTGIPTKTRPPAPDDPNVNGVRIIQRYGPGSQHRLSPETQAGISQSLNTFMRDFPQVAEIWGLSWVAVDRQLHGKVKGGSYIAAVNQYVPGSGIHLNEERWMDEPKLLEHAKQSAAAGYTAVGTPAGIIAHELGHVVAATIHLLQTGKAGRIGDADSPLYDAVADRFKDWAGMKSGRQLSGRGKIDVDEALAEAFADVLVNGRGKTSFAGSEWLYDTMTEHLKTATPNKYKFWGAPGGKSTEALSPPTPDTPYVTVVDDLRYELKGLDNYSDQVRDVHRQRIAWQLDKSTPFGGNPIISGGVENYLGPNYGPINSRLRGTKMEWGASDETIDGWVEGIRQAFRLTGPVPDDIEYLYRGVSKKNRKRFFTSKMIPGAEFIEHGLSSTAHATKTPLDFVQGAPEYAIIRIRIPDEMRDVNVLAGIEREDEWVLPPGSKFKVTEVLEERDERGFGIKRLITVDWIGVPNDAARGGTAQGGYVPEGLQGEVSANVYGDDVSGSDALMDDDDLLGDLLNEENEGEFA